MSISVIDDFASAEEVADLLDIYTSSHNKAEAERCLECNKPYYHFLYAEHELFKKYTNAIEELHDTKLQLSYCGISIMVNTALKYHADNCSPEDDRLLGTPSDSDARHGLSDIDGVAWIPNHCHTRILTGVLYLNTLPSLGATVFPQHDTKIYPTKGTLLTFPCDNNYIHGVENTGKNIRLASLLWYVKG